MFRVPLIIHVALAVCLAGVHATGAQEAPADSLLYLEPETAPELIHFQNAEYPTEALRKGIEGQVLLKLLVNTEGSVDSVNVVESLEPSLDAAAAAAAMDFLFTPARADDEAVAVHVHFAYEFSVREQTRHIEEYVNFQGRLLERGTRDPLSEAMVVVSFPAGDKGSSLTVPWDAYLDRIGRFNGQYREENRLVAFTDSTGRFSFRSLPAGLIRLDFPNAGYEAFDTREQLNQNELLEATYWLNRTSCNDYEIVVYGRAEQKEVTRQSLSVTEVEKLPGFGGDVIKSIQALPGVARPAMSNPGAIVIRGSGNYDTRYFLDGVDIPLLFHYGGVKSTYNSLALQSVDLYPGGYGTRYGGVVGGVVEIKGRPPKTDRWHFVGDASLLDVSFHAEGPLGRGWSALVTARRSFFGEILDAALKSVDDLNVSVVPYYWDVVARLNYDQNPSNRFFLTAFAVKDRMELIFPEAKEGSAEVNAATNTIGMSLAFSRYILGWDRVLRPGLRNELRAACGRSSENGHVFGYFDFENSGPHYQLRDELSWDASEHLTPNAGIDLVWNPYDYRVKVEGFASSIQSKVFSDMGCYANLEWRPSKSLLVIPGFRYDHYQHLKEGQGSIRLTSRYSLNDNHTLTGGIGTYNQPPQPIGQSTDPIYGNPDLPPTLATHATLGDEWKLGDRLSLKMEGYYNTQRNIPATTDSLDLNFVPDAKARMYGLEFMLRAESSDRFFGWISYCLARSERKYARRPGESMGDNHGTGGQNSGEWDPDGWTLSSMDQTHHIEALGSCRLGRSWSVGARVQYVSGNPQTPLLSYDGDQYAFDSDTGNYVPVYGDYLEDRMEPYVRMDLRIDKTFVRKNSVWKVYLDVQNANYFIYNSPEGYNYNYDYSRRKEYGWIIMPSLGCRVEF